MRTVGKWLAGLMALVGASFASGGLVVTSYRTVAQTNGYAPTNQSQYFAEQRLENVSPAVAEVFGDWTGPNADGTPNTWHFVGTSRSSSTTTVTSVSYTVEAAASFTYTLDTTAEFLDPLSVSLFAPAGAANYRGFFQTDIPLIYSVTAQLKERCRVRLDSTVGGVIFNEGVTTGTPRQVNLTGAIPPGQYQFLATTGLSIGNSASPSDHLVRTGGFESLVFVVGVPEPGVHSVTAIVITLHAICRFRRDPRRK